jgi:hypothetical protein
MRPKVLFRTGLPALQLRASGYREVVDPSLLWTVVGAVAAVAAVALAAWQIRMGYFDRHVSRASGVLVFRSFWVRDAGVVPGLVFRIPRAQPRWQGWMLPFSPVMPVRARMAIP